LIVTRTDDAAGGVCRAGNCTLRQAVQASNACRGAQVIRIPAGTYARRVRKRIVSFTMSLRGWFPRSNLLGREGS
jgi:CSLREA domain-containing protein